MLSAEPGGSMKPKYKYRTRMQSSCGLEVHKLDIYEVLEDDRLDWILGCTFWTEAAAKQALMRYRDRARRGLPLLGTDPEAKTISYEEILR